MSAKAGKFKCTNSVVVLISIFLIGYALIVYSMLFGKSSQYSDIVSQELSDSVYNNEFLKLQLKEKEEELNRLKNLVKEKSFVSLNNPSDLTVRPGVIILGMHRSGTSVLGGLANKMGLKTGGPLIAPAEDNAKGFFERIDVVIQNDLLMQRQHVHYSANTYRYDAQVGLQDIESKQVVFKEGERGLAFLNNPQSVPWMLKDPRLCITLRTWLPLLKGVPAILFSYRHPMDVAQSMHKRETEHFRVARGLKMWYIYNRRAIDQSSDLCRVVTSHRSVMSQPQIEFDRIFTELQQCGVAVPHKVTRADINSFIDEKLQHGRSTQKDTSCGSDLSTLQPPDSWPTTDAEHLSLYREVMRVYCALEDGSALLPNFSWDQSIKDM